MRLRTISESGSFLLFATALTALALGAATGRAADPPAVSISGGTEPVSPAPTNAAPARTETQRSAEVLPAHFQATVYEIQAAADRLGALDAKALAARAATAEELLSALASVGTARILYRIDQPVNVYSERITIGGSEPVVTGARMSGTGETVKSITYHNVGVIVRLTAKAPSKESNRRDPDVTMAIQLAALAASNTELAPGVKATATRTLSLEHSEPLEFGRPLVMLSASTLAAGAEAPPAVYAIRYLFSPPAGK